MINWLQSGGCCCPDDTLLSELCRIAGTRWTVEQRTGYVQGFLQNRFSLSDIVLVTLNTGGEAGYIRINDRDIATDTPVTDSIEVALGSGGAIVQAVFQ